MMNNLIQNLKGKYLKLFPNETGVTNEELDEIENKLNIILPKDFREIAAFYKGGIIGGQSLYTITSDEKDEYGLINRTKTFREAINLPKDFLPLYSEYGFIYLNLQTNSPYSGNVIYCENEEVGKLRDLLHPLQPYKIYSSFAQFIEYLLSEEEQERKTV